MNLWRRVPEGLVAALERGARAGLRYGVVSNSEGRLAELLDAVGLGRFLEVVIDSGRAGVQKPDPRIFLLATDAMGVAPSEAIYAGDVPHVDVDGARAAGLGAVLVDAFDDFDAYDEAPKVRSVAELIDAWL
jgi:putative hydrolase of the HAD superfamily